MKIIAISLAFGDIFEDRGTGSLKIPRDGAVHRFETILKSLGRNQDVMIICSAGYSRREALRPTPERPVSLADQLQRFVREYAPAWLPRLITAPRCWSTRNEIRVAIKIAQRLQFANTDDKVAIVIASNLAHLFRIWLYTRVYIPRNWKVVLLRARHAFPFWMTILEPVKIARDVWYTARVLNRLNSLSSR